MTAHLLTNTIMII